MTVTTGNQFCKAIADILGLKLTREITISMRFDGVVCVNVEMLLSEEDGKKITGFLQRKRFKLELLDEEDPIDMRAADGLVETTAIGDKYKTRQYVEAG